MHCMIFIKDMDHFLICTIKFCKSLMLQKLAVGERYSYSYSYSIAVHKSLINFIVCMQPWQHEYRSAEILEKLLDDSKFWDLPELQVPEKFTREDLDFIQGMITFSEDLSMIEKQQGRNGTSADDRHNKGMKVIQMHQGCIIIIMHACIMHTEFTHVLLYVGNS